MSGFGMLTDYRSGTPLRPATAAEWRKTADSHHGGGAGGYTGAFELDGRAVFVDGGPDTAVSRNDIIGLAQEAGQAGDTAMARTADTALCVNDGYQATADETEQAWGECVKVILDHRMNAA